PDERMREAQVADRRDSFPTKPRMTPEVGFDVSAFGPDVIVVEDDNVPACGTDARVAGRSLPLIVGVPEINQVLRAAREALDVRPRIIRRRIVYNENLVAARGHRLLEIPGKRSLEKLAPVVGRN